MIKILINNKYNFWNNNDNKNKDDRINFDKVFEDYKNQ